MWLGGVRRREDGAVKALAQARGGSAPAYDIPHTLSRRCARLLDTDAATWPRCPRWKAGRASFGTGGETVNALWMSVLQHLALLLLQLVVISLLVLAHRLQPAVARWLVQHTTAKERALLRELAREAYWLAEQSLPGATGQEKLSVALQYLAGIGKRLGLAVTPDEVRAAIEVAVAEAKALAAPMQAGKSSGTGTGA